MFGNLIHRKSGNMVHEVEADGMIERLEFVRQIVRIWNARGL